MIKIISFDLDGTLADEKFDDFIWWQDIPKMYSEKHKIPFQDAQDKVMAEYYRAEWIHKLKWDQWTDIEYWMKKFELGDWKELLEKAKHHVGIFEDVEETLTALHKKHKLIVVSNANQKFLELKLTALGLKKYFDTIYSCPSHFGIRKSKPVFQKIIEEQKIKPEQILHVGDDHDGDYLTPKELGMHAYHLIRDIKRKGKHIRTLKELPDKIKDLS